MYNTQAAHDVGASMAAESRQTRLWPVESEHIKFSVQKADRPQLQFSVTLPKAEAVQGLN